MTQIDNIQGLLDGSLDNPPPYIIPYEHEGNLGELAIFPEVVDWLHVPPWNGSAQSCPSDEDFYGYTKLEWDVGRCVFFNEDESIPEIFVDKKKHEFSGETLDSVNERVLQYCLEVAQENCEDEDCDYVLSINYIKK